MTKSSRNLNIWVSILSKWAHWNESRIDFPLNLSCIAWGGSVSCWKFRFPGCDLGASIILILLCKAFIMIILSVNSSILSLTAIMVFTISRILVSAIIDLSPGNMRRWPSVGLLLAHRLRRWPNSNPTFGQRLIFAESRWSCEKIQTLLLNGKQKHMLSVDKVFVWRHSLFLFALFVDQHK